MPVNAEIRDARDNSGDDNSGRAARVTARGASQRRTEQQMEPSLHIVCPHCDTINRVPRAKLEQPESRRRPLRPMP